MEDTHIVQMYWDRNETAISESAMKYGTYCTSIAQNILPCRHLPDSAASRRCGGMPGGHMDGGVERYAAAPAVSVIHISWKNNEKSFV